MVNHAKQLRTIPVMAGILVAASASAQVDIARWSFKSTVAAPYNTPAATTMLTSASATQLGMTNSYNGGNTASCDVVATTGNVDPASAGNAWRIRGTSANGWALAAPEYTQGAQFDVSTVGYSNIVFSFDWYSTNQGIKNLQVQYNTNVNNPSGWTNFAGTFAGNVATVKDASGATQLVATASGYNTTGTNVKSNILDFSANGIAGVANDANFGIRLVAAYDPSVTPLTYSGASGGTYNNTSGNWRFDQIAVQGMVPEPATFLPVALGACGLLLRRRRRA